MQKICLMFPGQGSQKPGMAKEFTEKYPDLSDKIWGAVGGNIRTLAESEADTDKAELDKTENAQLAISAVSLISAQGITADGVTITAAAGHSLGEYAMLAAAGVISPADMFALVRFRAKAMAECCAKNPGIMYAVMTADTALLTKLCSETGGVSPVNYNSDAQTVIAGGVTECEKVAAALSDLGIRAVRLNVSGAFHTPLMGEAAERLKIFAKDINFGKPSFPVWSNLTGRQFTAAQLDNMPDYLAAHMVSPVRFTDEIREIAALENVEFTETFGKTLSGMVKRIKV